MNEINEGGMLGTSEPGEFENPLRVILAHRMTSEATHRRIIASTVVFEKRKMPRIRGGERRAALRRP